MNWLYRLFFWLYSKSEKSKPKKGEEPRWYSLAKQEIGEKEISGSRDNKRIVEYHQATSLKATDDETPWCASFVCWCLETSGIKSTRSASARSFERWGREVPLSQARLGDIAVFWRGSRNGWKGHVGFYSGRDNGHIRVLGGNQSNAVNISKYSESQLLSIRRPV